MCVGPIHFSVLSHSINIRSKCPRKKIIFYLKIAILQKWTVRKWKFSRKSPAEKPFFDQILNFYLKNDQNSK